MDYLPATALAVQAAVLHNFVWHERWTWGDRTANHDSSRLARLLRFNLTIGALSIGENLLFMGFLVGRFEFHYLSANLIAIACCSVLNFVASDRLVFREAM
jgi:putative flippase GtrA